MAQDNASSYVRGQAERGELPTGRTYGRNLLDLPQSRVAISNMPMDPGATDFFRGVSENLNREAEVQLKDWQEAVVKQATIEGELEGASKDTVDWKDTNTLRGQAYNAGATKSFEYKTRLQNQARMDALADQFQNDPDGYVKAATAFRDELATKMGQHSQTAVLGKQFVAEMDLDIQRNKLNIDKTVIAQKNEQRKADDLDSISLIETNSYRTAKGLVSNNQDEQRISLQSYHKNKTMLENLYSAVDEKGRPVYSPKEKETALNEFREDYWYNGVAANIDNMNGKDLAAILNDGFEVQTPGGGRVNVMNQVGMKKYTQLKRLVVDKLKQDEANYKERTAKDEKAAKERQEKNGYNTYLLAAEGKTTLADVSKQVYNGDITPEAGKAAANKIIETDGGGAMDNPEVVGMLKQRLARGQSIQSELAKPEIANQLSKKTFYSLVEDEAKSETKILSPVLDMVTKKDMETGFDTPGSELAKEDLRKQYYVFINEGDTPTQAREKLIPLAKQMIAQFGEERQRLLIVKVNTPEGKIDFPATVKALQEKLAAGIITEDVYKGEIALLVGMKEDSK